jgi:CMP/dCMP kinase
MSKLRIAIDGTASAGKGSIAKGISRRLRFPYVDTGAMYRALALLLKRQRIAVDDHQKIERVLQDISFEFFWKEDDLRLIVDGEDCTDLIRTEEIGQGASIVSTNLKVRSALSEIQKEYAKSSSLVMDGRDIGTVIIPDAELKVFVDANINVRAKRRYLEMVKKGISTELNVVLEELRERDFRDSTRKLAPLKKASDARLLDTTNIGIEDGIEVIYKWVQAII